MAINYVKIEEGTKVQTATKQKPVFGLGNTRSEVGNPDVLMGGEWFNSVNGSEKVVNGKDLVDTTGWGADNDALLSVENGNLVVTANVTDNPSASQTISVEVGKTYTMGKPSHGGTFARVDLDNIGDGNGNATDNGITFIAEFDTVRIQLWAITDGDSDSEWFNDISIFETNILPDTPYSPQITYLDNSFEVDVAGNIAVIHDDFKVPDIVSDSIMASKFEWANDGIDYIDEDAIGANPTAKIYPDGSIVGSTDNGSYIKLANGSLFCKYTSPTVLTTQYLVGVVYESSNIEMFYPIAFVARPDSNIISYYNAAITWGVPYTQSASSVRAVLVGGADTSKGHVGYESIGRWK